MPAARPIRPDSSRRTSSSASTATRSSSPRSCRRLIAGIRPGSEADLEVWRGQGTKHINVTVEELKDKGSMSRTSAGGKESDKLDALGLSVRELSAAEKTQLHTTGSVVITETDGPVGGGGPAQRGGDPGREPDAGKFGQRVAQCRARGRAFDRPAGAELRSLAGREPAAHRDRSTRLGTATTRRPAGPDPEQPAASCILGRIHRCPALVRLSRPCKNDTNRPPLSAPLRTIGIPSASFRGP